MQLHFSLLPHCAVVATTVAFERKKVFFLTSPWFQHLFRIAYNPPNTVKKALHQGTRGVLRCCIRLLQPSRCSEVLLGWLWLGRRSEWPYKVM